jgi:hypothetical protein
VQLMGVEKTLPRRQLTLPSPSARYCTKCLIYYITTLSDLLKDNLPQLPFTACHPPNLARPLSTLPQIIK